MKCKLASEGMLAEAIQNIQRIILLSLARLHHCCDLSELRNENQSFLNFAANVQFLLQERDKKLQEFR